MPRTLEPLLVRLRTPDSANREVPTIDEPLPHPVEAVVPHTGTRYTRVGRETTDDE